MTTQPYFNDRELRQLGLSLETIEALRSVFTALTSLNAVGVRSNTSALTAEEQSAVLVAALTPDAPPLPPAYPVPQEQHPHFVFPSIPCDDVVIIDTATNYTTTGVEDVVIATSNITITLNATPQDGEKVVCKRDTASGAVTVSAGSNTIDGAGSASIASNNGALTAVYSADYGEWIITSEK